MGVGDACYDEWGRGEGGGGEFLFLTVESDAD